MTLYANTDGASRGNPGESGIGVICRDSDDNCVIETALKGKAEYLVTGDRDIKSDHDVVAFLAKHAVSVISITDFLNLFNKP
mgnify:CR=1 FL=1